MKFLNIALIALTVLMGGSTYANTPSDASINKLAEVMPYEQAFANIAFSDLHLYGENLAFGLANDSKLSEKQRTDALKTYETFANNLIKELTTPAKKAELKKAFLSSAKQTYTQEEVDALLAFYGNKTLQSALDKGDTVLAGYLKSVEKSTNDTIEKYNKTHLTKMQDSIKRITNQ